MALFFTLLGTKNTFLTSTLKDDCRAFENRTQNHDIGVEVFYQKWRYYLHYKSSISTKRPQIQAQIDKSGDSGDVGGILRLYLESIVMEKQASICPMDKKGGELLLLLLILIRSDKP